MSKVNTLEEFYHKVHINIIESINKDMNHHLDDADDIALYTKKKNMALEASFSAVLSILKSMSCKDCRDGAIKSFIKRLKKEKNIL
jgi:hypothetical protein